MPLVSGREISTIFIGGGTPSLLSAEAMQQLLDGVRARLPVASDAEITMEANPGAVEADRFSGYQRAGINRISIGVQSFSAQKLTRLGRIHGPDEARRAAELATSLQLRSFNLDLMHGLPDQTLEEALDDLRQAIALNPPHLSWYQLTIEPNTGFSSRPQSCPMTMRYGIFSSKVISYSVPLVICNMKPRPMPSQVTNASIILTTGALVIIWGLAVGRMARSHLTMGVFYGP